MKKPYLCSNLNKTIMSSIIKHYNRSRRPNGFWGKRALKVMNSKQHEAMPTWALAFVEACEDCRVLDVGCGGGANIARLLEKFPKSIVTGMDVSPLALDKSRDLNYHAVVDGRCFIIGGNAVQMPLAKETFDVVTSFETIYYWPSLLSGANEAFRILKPGGTWVIANELDGLQESDRALERATGIMRVYSINEITQDLAEAGFTDITTHHDEERHFVCVIGHKP